jgi:hypothetical protein
MSFDATKLLSQLLGYTETWWQDPGYGGLFIHPSWSVTNLHYFGPHSSQNASGVKAFLTLYKKFGREEWLERSIACADLLVSLARPGGVFGNSTAEFNPEEGCLIHNTLSDIALLTLAQYLTDTGLDPQRSDRYIDVVKRNIDWFIDYWWNGRYFCGTINQDLTAAIAMAMYERMVGVSGYGSYIDALIDYVQSMREQDGPTAGAIRRSDEPGGRILASSHQANKAVRLLELSEMYGNERLLPLALGVARFIFRQQRPDGFFDWGYLEEEGRLRKRMYPLSASVEIARCGQRFESYIPTFDWRRYLSLILGEVPLRVTARGFGETATNDWRSRASSPDNVPILEFLAEITEEEPVMEPFEGLVFSRGPDVLTGDASYVLIESLESLFRIAELPAPALDLVLSKKAELPIVYPGLTGEPSFVVFSDDRPGETWSYDPTFGVAGSYRYTLGARERIFRLQRGVLEVVQRPYSGVPICFEASPRNSSINRLVTEVAGTIIKERWFQLDGRKETVIEAPAAWFTISNTSFRLRNGDVKVSFSRPVRRLVMDHRSANPQGKLRLSVEAEACEELVVTVEPGHFPIPGHKHIN